MQLPPELFLNSIETRKVYRFSSVKLNTDIPHYFICVLQIDRNLILVCCTSDRDKKRQRRAELLNLYETLVWIERTETNGFSKDTFVDCNSFFRYTIDDFKQMYESGEISYTGEIEEEKFAEIINGILKSPEIEEEIKDMLL